MEEPIRLRKKRYSPAGYMLTVDDHNNRYAKCTLVRRSLTGTEFCLHVKSLFSFNLVKLRNGLRFGELH